jgi:hypothetical protein
MLGPYWNYTLSLSSLIKGCCWVLIGMIVFHKLSGFPFTKEESEAEGS